MAEIKPRNQALDVLRIAATVLVPLTHVLNKNYTASDGSMREAVAMLNSLCIIAVPCFFMITGYFTHIGQSYIKKLKRTAVSILLPALLAVVVYQALWAWVTGTATLKESVLGADYRQMWREITLWNIKSLPGCTVFWYITDYVRLMLLFPVTALMCTDTPSAKRARWAVIGLVLASYLLKDVQQFAAFEGKLYEPFDRTVVYFLIGYELKTIRWNKVSGKVLLLLSAVSIGAMYVLTKLLYYSAGSFSDYFFHYTTSVCVVASASVFALTLKANDKGLFQRKSRIRNVLSDASFYVYLVHNIVLHGMLKRTWLGRQTAFGWLLVQWIVVVCLSFAMAIAIRRLQKWLGNILRPAKPDKGEKQRNVCKTEL